MKLNRFFVAEKLGIKSSVTISRTPFINQIKNVFRLSKGDAVILFDNSGYDFTAVIDEYKKDSVSFSIIKNRFYKRRGF